MTTWLDRDLTEKGWHNYHSLGHAYEPDTHPTHDFEACTAPACVWARGEMGVATGFYIPCEEGRHAHCPQGHIDGYADCLCPCHEGYDRGHKEGFGWGRYEASQDTQADPSNTASPAADPESRETGAVVQETLQERTPDQEFVASLVTEARDGVIRMARRAVAWGSKMLPELNQAILLYDRVTDSQAQAATPVTPSSDDGAWDRGYQRGWNSALEGVADFCRDSTEASQDGAP